MKSRVVRVSDALWTAAIERSQVVSKPRRVTVYLRGDETVSEAVRKFLERYSR